MIKFKKVCSLLLAVALTLNIAGVPQSNVAKAAKKYTCGEYKYKILEDGTAEIVSYAGTGSSVTVPSELDGYTVTSLGFTAFYDCVDLEKVVLPKTITEIHMGAFDGCSKLEQIKVANENPKYATVSGVLLNKKKTVLLRCPEGKKKYTFSNKIKKIKDRAFERCSKLQEVSNLNKIKIIPEYAFSDCSKLKKITLGSKLQKINKSAFSDCYSLEQIEIPDEVRYIGESAFRNCYNLKKINIPAACTYVASDFIRNSDELSAIKVDSKNKKYCSQSGVLYSKDKTTLISFPGGRENYKMPAGVKKIKAEAFADSNIKKIILSKSLEVIEEEAFNCCMGLKKIVLPKNVSVIGSLAFAESKKLKKIQVYSAKIQYVGDDAFFSVSSKVKFTFKGEAKKKGKKYKKMFMVES